MFAIAYYSYRIITRLIALFVAYYLKRRALKGKEDPQRLSERFGQASVDRPKGKLVWFHGASVGESLSLIKLLQVIREEAPSLNILVTTGTVTSAKFMKKNLPKGVIHQYVPLDIPQWINTFLNHWQPQMAVLLESEIWPNILMDLKKREIPIILLNGNLSDKTYGRWARFSRLSKPLFNAFHTCLTPSTLTADRYKSLGISNVHLTTNLKFTCDPLTFDASQASTLRQAIGKRPLWAAASTHAGEEELVLQAHETLKPDHPGLLTIIVPRHCERSTQIKEWAHQKGLTVAQHSLKEPITDDIDIWLVDTMGDMGLVYNLADIVLIGGSFVPLGGHNPIEAIQHKAVVLHGPYDKNFRDNYSILQPVMIKTNTQEDLVHHVNRFLKDPEERRLYHEQGLAILENEQAGIKDIFHHLMKVLRS